MEALIILLLVIALVHFYGRLRTLRDDLDRLTLQVDLLRAPPANVAPPQPAREPSPVPAAAPSPIPTPSPVVQPVIVAAAPPPDRVPSTPRMTPVAPPLLEPIPAGTAPAEPPGTAWMERLRESAPIDWEQFMGVKLFAWVGGLAMFLGIVFFVKHAFDQGLIPPEMRVALGFLAGLAMVAGGAVLHRRNYQMPAQTLCATGILV
jgi:uncharacterized membrane protein